MKGRERHEKCPPLVFFNTHGVGINSGCNYSGGSKAMYHTLLEGVWLSDIGRMTEVRNVPHLAWCEYRVCSHWVTIIVCHFHDTHTLQARCGTFLSSAICN